MMKKTAAAFLLLTAMACSPKAQIGNLPADHISTEDKGMDAVEPKVDILFVIDNSGSMDSHQRDVANNIDKFVANFFDTIQIDFHVAVTTTDARSHSAGLNDMRGGVMIGSTPYVDRNTFDFKGEISRRIRSAGTSGDATEKSFDPVYLALTPPMIDTYNTGFLREDAFLAIVFVTDAEDQSTLMTPTTLAAFLSEKKGGLSHVLPYAVIVPTTDNVCSRDENGVFPRRIEQFINMAVTQGHNEFSLCDPNFGDRLAEIGKDVAARVGSVLRLTQVPQPHTIVLKFGTQVIPQDPYVGWQWDPDDNSIHLGSKIVWTTQPPGTRLTIHYDPNPHQDPLPPGN